MNKCRRCGEEVIESFCGCPDLILTVEGLGDVKFWQHKDHGPHRFGLVEYPDGTRDAVILVHESPNWFTPDWEWVDEPGYAYGMGTRPVPAEGSPKHVVTAVSPEGCRPDIG